MRLAKVSLLAVSVSMTLSGCAAYRGATQSVTPEPESLTLPPRHAQEYHPPRSYQDPDGGPENTESNSPHAPIQPPPVPPAFGVSRVKSVGFIRDLGAKVSGPFQGRSSESAAAAGCAPPVACTDEGCKSTDDRRPGCCLVRALKKSRSICSVWKNAHRRYSPCADADVSSPCIPQDDACGRVISSACGDVFAGDLPGLIAPGECCGRGLCAPRPGWASGCGPASRDSAGCMPTGPGGLQRPCLSDSLSDPFLDPQNRAGSSWPGVSPAPPQRPFHEPTEGSSDTVPPGVVPAPPTPDEADRRSDALPLWPRLEREQPEGEPRVRAAQASLRYSDRAATRAEDLRLPQIIPRPTH